jgi:hypothetical protein
MGRRSFGAGEDILFSFQQNSINMRRQAEKSMQFSRLESDLSKSTARPEENSRYYLNSFVPFHIGHGLHFLLMYLHTAAYRYARRVC